MYGIFTYIYHKNQPNVGKYTSPMDPMGEMFLQVIFSDDDISRDIRIYGTNLFLWISLIFGEVGQRKLVGLLGCPRKLVNGL